MQRVLIYYDSYILFASVIWGIQAHYTLKVNCIEGWM